MEQPVAIEGEYAEESALGAAFTVGLQSAAVGLFVSAAQNSLQSHNKGAMGVFTRTGGTIGLFG
jgi:hypothetical protein